MTGEEYQQIVNASAEQGARCLSDFARDVLLRAVRARDDRSPLERRLEAIEKRVAGLVPAGDPSEQDS
jgi:hypothetical protein